MGTAEAIPFSFDSTPHTTTDSQQENGSELIGVGSSDCTEGIQVPLLSI